jgi:hypothetical protein
MLAGIVDSVEPKAVNGVILVRVALSRPSAVPAGTQIDGLIELGRLKDVVMVGRPVQAQAQSEATLFKLDADGSHASKVRVRFGRSSVNTIEVVEAFNRATASSLRQPRLSRYDRITPTVAGRRAIVPIPGGTPQRWRSSGRVLTPAP